MLAEGDGFAGAILQYGADLETQAIGLPEGDESVARHTQRTRAGRDPQITFAILAAGDYGVRLNSGIGEKFEAAGGEFENRSIKHRADDAGWGLLDFPDLRRAAVGAGIEVRRLAGMLWENRMRVQNVKAAAPNGMNHRE